MTDRIGQQLGNYQLLRLLGEGGIAEVYLGEHTHLGTQAAIKAFRTELSSDDMDQFRTEAKTLARLIHPSIVRVLEFGIEGQTPYLIMDYAPNGTLRQRHPKGVALPLPLIVGYVKQIADALQCAHDEEVIHRDVKPENMLLGRRNEILLSDFGIALVAQSSRSQSDQEIAGTMAYMAPEQIQGKPRPASDQYALGIVVYEWLSGDRPFHGSLTELVDQHLTVAPPSLREKVSTISPEVDQVVLTALAKDPKERFESIQIMASALREAAQVPPSTGTLSPPMVAPTIPAESASQPPSDEKSPTLVSPLTETEAADLEPATQAADVSLSARPSAEALHSTSQDPPGNAAPLFPQKYRPSRRLSLLIGGALGFISLLVVLILTFKPILFVRGGPSVPPTTYPHTSSPTQSVPSATPIRPDHVVQKWVFSTGTGGRVYSSQAVVNDVLYIGASSVLDVYALDASTGQQKWTFSTGGGVYTSPAVVNGVLYVGSDNDADKKVYAIDANTGQEKWTFSTGRYDQTLTSSPTVVNGVLYIGGDKLYAIDANTGQEKWAFPINGTMWYSPTVVNGVLYIGSTDQNVYAIDASTGQEKWAFTTGYLLQFSSATVVNGVLYIGGDKLYAIDASTGQEKWAFPTDRLLPFFSPTVTNGMLYVGSDDHNVYAIDASTGQEKWTFPTGGAVRSSPTVVNGVLYVGSTDQNVYAIDANTGQKIWAFPTSGAVDSSPTLVNGVLYVGSEDGKVYALTLPAS